MTWLPVDVQTDHLESLVRGEPISGVIELVWNAIDAEAENVHVIVAESPLGGVEETRVEDDGHGMTRAEIDEEFAHLGGSWKRLAQHSKYGKRVLHGAEGKGRWRAFTIGPVVHWATVAPAESPRQKTVITGRSDRLGGFEVTDPASTDEPAGTVVKVTCAQPGPSGLLGDRAPKILTATLALHLQRYRDSARSPTEGRSSTQRRFRTARSTTGSTPLANTATGNSRSSNGPRTCRSSGASFCATHRVWFWTTSRPGSKPRASYSPPTPSGMDFGRWRPVVAGRH